MDTNHTTELASAENDSLVDVSVAARMLGLTSITLRRWDKAGKLPAVRVGARRKYRLADLRAIQKRGI